MGKPAGYGFSIAGWVSEGNLAAIRKRKREYRVGTTRSKLKRFDLSLKILGGFEINNIEGGPAALSHNSDRVQRTLARVS
jgi:hypothetical protein